MSLGDNIAARRKQMRLSQESLAGQLGVSRQAVSKWETGQTEPTAKNLVELAKLFGITVSELVDPERIAPPKPVKNWRLGLERFAIIAYSGSAVLYTIETEDPLFPLFAVFLILASAIWMGVNILRLPRRIRTKMACRELCYCVVIFCIVTFLEPVIRNVLTSAVITLCCVVYICHVRFPEDLYQQ